MYVPDGVVFAGSRPSNRDTPGYEYIRGFTSKSKRVCSIGWLKKLTDMNPFVTGEYAMNHRNYCEDFRDIVTHYILENVLSPEERIGVRNAAIAIQDQDNFKLGTPRMIQPNFSISICGRDR